LGNGGLILNGEIVYVNYTSGVDYSWFVLFNSFVTIVGKNVEGGRMGY